MRKGVPAIFAVCALLCGSVTASVADGSPPKKVAFITHWSPQAQFAGYYVAREKGFYAERGLDVEFLPSGPGISASQALADGKADIAILWLSQALQNRSKGVRLVNLGQMVQRSGLMFVARRSAGILKPADLDGKKVSLWGGDLRLQGEAFIAQYGLHVRKIPQSYTVNLFLAGGVDAAMAMWYNEYHTILNSGLDPDELTVFFFKDLGLNVPEDGIYMLEGRYRQDPSLARAFVEASIRGWVYAFDHPDEAVAIVLRRMREANLPANEAHQRWMLKTMEQLMADGRDRSRMGLLSPEDYRAVSAMLKESGLIDTVTDFESFFIPAGAHAET